VHEHDTNTTYRVSVISIVTEGKIEEISFVDRPVQPEARLVAIPLSVEDLQELLGPEFFPRNARQLRSVPA
jgi:hypothetical protein